MKHKFIFFVIGLVMFLSRPPVSGQVFVKQGATGAGTSWDNARGTVPTGTLAAGTKIYIAAGNYQIAAGTDLEENGILIQGGFPVTARGTDVSGYNPVNHVTTLTRSGTGNNRNFYSEGSTNSADVNNIIEVKGIRFTGAHDNGSLFSLSTGYGIYRFTDVTAYNMTSTNGVIYLSTFNGGSVTLTNCNFYGNTSTADGGVVYHSTDSNNAKLIIRRSSFTNNAADHGGALYISSVNDAADAVLIENSNFCNNTSTRYGGAIYQTGSRIKITGSVFSNNSCPVDYYGGAIFATTSQLTIDDSRFYNNQGGDGGAIYSTTAYGGSTNTLSNSVFYRNRSTSNGNAAGTSGGGAMVITANANAWTINSTKFVANEVLAASWGGAISHYDAQTSLANCLFFGNTKGGATGVSGSDIKNYDNSGGFFSITNTKMQLAGSASYTNQAGGTGASSYGFGSGNTFNNADAGGITDPGFSCPITIVFTDPFVTVPDFNVTFKNVEVPGNVSTNDIYLSGTTYGTPVPDGSNPAGGGTINMNPDGSYAFTGTVPGVYVYQVPVCIPSGGTPCPIETLTITVLEKGQPNPPVANPDYATGQGSSSGSAQPITSIVKANDGPGNVGGLLGDPSITSPAPPASVGTIAVVGGNVVFTPAQGFYGEYEASYSVCETPGGLCATTTVTFLVNGPGTTNTTAAADDYVSTTTGMPVSGNVKTNDTDAEGDVQTVTPQTTEITGKGTLVLAADGSYTFTPAPGFTGPVEFVYQTCDDGTPSVCHSATLHVMVFAVPDLKPTIVILPSLTFGNQSITIRLQANEVGGLNTSGLITMNVRESANWQIGISPGANVGIWTYVGVVGVNHRFTTSQSIAAGTFSRINVPATFKPGGNSGKYVFTLSILSNSGGEVNNTNNSDQETITYNK